MLWIDAPNTGQSVGARCIVPLHASPEQSYKFYQSIMKFISANGHGAPCPYNISNHYDCPPQIQNNLKVLLIPYWNPVSIQTLYKKHSHSITQISKLKNGNDCEKKEPVEALYMEVISEDTNGDGELDDEDHTTIALTDPSGYHYMEIENSIQSVMDKKVMDDGKHLLIIAQIGGSVWLKKYSLITFEKVSEKIISEIRTNR